MAKNREAEPKIGGGKRTRIGIVDTMFARVNMGALAIDEIKRHYPGVEIVRTTVPGIKDLPPECKKLLDSGCGVCMALGMVGGAPIDTICAHEASTGLIQAKLMTGKHIIEVFVHENEGWDEKEFYSICENRARRHAHNAVLLATEPQELIRSAGKGIRQGRENEGEIDLSAQGKIGLGIVVAEFNKEISGKMLEFALEQAKEEGAEVRKIIRVAGAFEIPLASKKLLMDKKIDAVATLGFVKKGETRHDRIISESAAQALTALSLEHRKPVSLGIITIADLNQARERNEGYSRRAVTAAVNLVKELRK